jgi:serine/threonine protein kinase
VEAELGRGGMGVVYRAKDLQLGRTVALKLLSEEYAKHNEQRQMILAEARIAASFNHPGVTTIYESLAAERSIPPLLQQSGQADGQEQACAQAPRDSERIGD